MNAAPGDFAETVLMPGDPLRAQYIADTYLDDVRRVTDVRNMWGFTGCLQRSAGFRHGAWHGDSLGVDLLHRADQRLRRQTCDPRWQLRHVASRRQVARHHYRDGRVHRFKLQPHALRWLRLCGAREFRSGAKSGGRGEERESALSRGQYFFGGPFLHAGPGMFETMAKYNVYGVEMEAAGMFAIAAENKCEALAVCTVSDDIVTGDALTRTKGDDVRRNDSGRTRNRRCRRVGKWLKASESCDAGPEQGPGRGRGWCQRACRPLSDRAASRTRRRSRP